MAKHSIYTTIKINATPDSVWNVLTDFDKYPEWNSFINTITGKLSVGKQITVQLPGMTFKPRVLTVEKDSELKWLGSLLFKGLFDGEHRFLLIDNKDGTTTLEHSENFSGVLVKLFSGKLDNETKAGFEQMNEQLKQRAESVQTT
ncbi:MAG: SRPBCC domain-containing protein [Bacteroidota bacterium]